MIRTDKTSPVSAVPLAQIKSKANLLMQKGHFNEAKPLLDKLAQEDDVDGQFWLGHYYSYGTSHDKTQAFGWFTKAAKQGHPAATYELAQHYAEGWGCKKDLQAALALYAGVLNDPALGPDAEQGVKTIFSHARVSSTDGNLGFKAEDGAFIFVGLRGWNPLHTRPKTEGPPV